MADGITLYPHQDRFVASVRAALREYRSILAQAPTGFGKTVVAAYIAASAVGKNNPILFLVHRRELVKQTLSTFEAFGIRTGVLAAGYPEDPEAMVQVGLIPSMKSRLDRFAPRVVIVDECHLSAAATWVAVVDHYLAAGAKLVGLTATPERLDGKPLDRFQTLVPGPSVRWLIDQGFLSDFRMFAPSTPDLTGVKRRGGDYATDQLAGVMMESAIVGDVVKHWRLLADGKRTIAFCVNRAHAEALAGKFRQSGIGAAPITGAMKDDERRNIIAALADGGIHVMTSVALCSEGFDLSAQIGREVPIEAAIMCRPTQSLALWMQMCGRSLRRKDRPAIILDHAGNALRHGLPDEPREWSLAGRPKRPGKSGGADAPVRQCQECYAVSPAAAVKCWACGVAFPVNQRSLKEVDGHLVELKKRREEEAAKAADRRRRAFEESRAETVDDLVRLAISRGYRNPYGWAAHRHQARQRRRAG